MEKSFEIEPASGMTKFGLSLLLAATTCAAISVITHTQAHQISQITLVLAMNFGSLGLLKVANSVAPVLPKFLQTSIHWIHALVFEWMALLFVIPWVHLVHLNRHYKHPLGTGLGKPILLVHGYCNDSSVWFFLRRKLAKAGLGPIYLVNLGSPFRSLDEYVEKVKSKCEQIRQETGHEELTLIGHSMGGLVCSICALESPCATDVITISSPLSGTHMAKMGIGKSARGMQIKSEFALKHAELIAANANIRFSHIGTKTDHLVIPNRSAFPGIQLEREFLFHDIGHASMLLSPRVAALLTHLIS